MTLVISIPMFTVVDKHPLKRLRDSEVYSELGTLFGHYLFLYCNVAVTSKESYLEELFSNFASFAF